MLGIITVVAFAAALICGGLLWRAVLHDRRRSAARIAALAEAIDATSEEPDHVRQSFRHEALPHEARLPQANSGWQAPAPLFDPERRSAMQGRPLLKVAIGFAMAVTVIVLIAVTGERAGAPDASQVAPAEAARLELVSMRHTREGEDLTVTGLVRNPGAIDADGVIAVVLAFDRRGDFVASGRAPIEESSLSSGEEAPFQVTIPRISDVGRYRVSFRSASGTVRHVDKRAASRVADTRPDAGGRP